MKPTLLHNIILCFLISTLTFSQTPANDTPAGATVLTVGVGSCSGNTAGGDLTNASNSNVGGTPSCGSVLISDVWYTAVVPASGNLAIETFNVSGSSFQSVLTAYTKDSSDVYTAVGCDDNSGTGTLSKLILSDQTAGTTVYIRVWGYFGDRDPFELCAWDPAVPANDSPAGATALMVGTSSCSGNTAGDLRSATNSNVGGIPSCGSDITSDVWYTAVVPASGNLAIETFNVGGSIFDSVLTAYTKDSSDVYTAVGCGDNGGTGNLSKLILSNQPAGTTVYIRVWGHNGDRDSFELCAWEPTVPANDTPAGATALTVGAGSCSGNTAGGDLTNASNSNVGGTPSCGSGISSDVWYTAVVPASGNLAIETSNIGGSYFDSVLTAYTKDSSDVYTAVGCNDDNSGTGDLSKLILSDQPAGTTVYIRVWGYFGDRDPFELCAWDPAVPANDTPAGATVLTVGAGSCSGNTAGGDLTNASNSNVGGTPSCGFGISSDVWYTAVVPASGNLAIETSNVSGSSFDSVLTAYTKDSSDVYTAVGCDDRGGTTNDPSKLILSDQTAGTTVYIRVWGYFGDRDPFELCAWDPAVPANDTPAGATALMVGTSSCSGNTAGDLRSATNSNVGGTPSCGSRLASDAWYTAVVPTSGNLTIETFNVGGSSFDSVLTAYTKDSSDVYTAVGCNDDGGTGALSKLILSDQPAGTTVYIRVWGYSGDRKPFELCAWAPVPLSTLELDEIVVRVYPIPTKNTLKIDTSLSLKSARVYSLTGKQLLSSALDQLTIDVSSLPSGIYLLQITHDKGSQHVKFIKE